jgi:hypothetical protein
MLSSGMLRRVAIVRTDVSEERRFLLPNIQEDSVRHSHRRENIKSYIALIGWAL